MCLFLPIRPISFRGVISNQQELQNAGLGIHRICESIGLTATWRLEVYILGRRKINCHGELRRGDLGDI
jgi:hypothetical protein